MKLIATEFMGTLRFLENCTVKNQKWGRLDSAKIYKTSDACIRKLEALKAQDPYAKIWWVAINDPNDIPGSVYDMVRSQGVPEVPASEACFSDYFAPQDYGWPHF
jgi:hypothetical protein